MTGNQFEVFIKEFFESQGYRAKLTKQSGDQGVDIILFIDDRKIQYRSF
ncbi:hypothetical protein CJ195_11225 [Bacillus sp. UMB0899]|nr:restriction endonuclease [Metabacillus schmidteae]PMC37327.1 hypothetical protein CJ195_11225 [Bacillus sp. UMB0899]